MSNKLKKSSGGSKSSTKDMTMEDIKKTNDILMKEVAALIDAEVEKRVAAEREAVKAEMMNIMFGIPVMVLRDKYWPKSYHRYLPTFVDHMLRYYEKWDGGLISTKEVKDVLWKDAGMQFDKDAAAVKCLGKVEI